MSVSERIRREVELLPWPEVIGGEDETPGEYLLAKAGELSIENEELRRLCERSTAKAEEWEGLYERAERLADGWRSEALSWRRLAVMAGLVLMVVGAWRLLG